MDSLPHRFCFALPPSLGPTALEKKRSALERLLSDAVGAGASVTIARNYQAMSDDLLSGEIDAAWAPPVVCARMELKNQRVLLRGFRHGAVTYRAALISRAGTALTAGRLEGLRAAWVDPESTGGYLLAMAYLRSRGWEPARLFSSQQFLGSYRAALQQVLDGQADLTSVFARVGGPADATSTGAEEIIPGSAAGISIVAFTEEGPNDGIVVRQDTPSEIAERLRRSFLELSDEAGRSLVREIFNVERFEIAPARGYRAFYGLISPTIAGGTTRRLR